jgi:hypothetical protein
MITFKTFNAFVEECNGKDEDQINEIFGKFFGKSPNQDKAGEQVKSLLQQKKEKEEEKKKEAEKARKKKKEEEWAKAKANLATRSAGRQYDRDDYALLRST